MAPSLVIRAIDFQPLDIALHTPFGISGGAQAMANNVLVRVELSDGAIGYGEGAPLPPYNGETQAQVLAALESGRSALIGRPADNWRGLGEEFRVRSGGKSGSAQAAFEMALLDAITRRDGV